MNKSKIVLRTGKIVDQYQSSTESLPTMQLPLMHLKMLVPLDAKMPTNHLRLCAALKTNKIAPIIIRDCNRALTRTLLFINFSFLANNNSKLNIRNLNTLDH